MKSKSFFIGRIIFYALMILSLYRQYQLQSPGFYGLILGFLAVIWYDWSFLCSAYWQRAVWMILLVLTICAMVADCISFNMFGLLIDLLPLSFCLRFLNIPKEDDHKSSQKAEG